MVLSQEVCQRMENSLVSGTANQRWQVNSVPQAVGTDGGWRLPLLCQMGGGGGMWQQGHGRASDVD